MTTLSRKGMNFNRKRYRPIDVKYLKFTFAFLLATLLCSGVFYETSLVKL